MMLMTAEQRRKLVENHTDQDGHKSYWPVIKLFGGSACTWLLTEFDADEGLFFGLCDLGLGSPELGYVSLQELVEIRFPPYGGGVERDLHWTATKSLSDYATEAKRLGRINA